MKAIAEKPDGVEEARERFSDAYSNDTVRRRKSSDHTSSHPPSTPEYHPMPGRAVLAHPSSTASRYPAPCSFKTSLTSPTRSLTNQTAWSRLSIYDVVGAHLSDGSGTPTRMAGGTCFLWDSEFVVLPVGREGVVGARSSLPLTV